MNKRDINKIIRDMKLNKIGVIYYPYEIDGEEMGEIEIYPIRRFEGDLEVLVLKRTYEYGEKIKEFIGLYDVEDLSWLLSDYDKKKITIEYREIVVKKIEDLKWKIQLFGDYIYVEFIDLGAGIEIYSLETPSLIFEEGEDEKGELVTYIKPKAEHIIESNNKIYAPLIKAFEDSEGILFYGWEIIGKFLKKLLPHIKRAEGGKDKEELIETIKEALSEE